MIVSITGASGFIGRILAARHLAQGDEVRALTRRAPETLGLPGVSVFHGDLTADAGPLREFADGADVLYHCAGEIRDPALMRAVHVEGTRALLGAAGGRVGRWVQLSSVGAYGPRESGHVDEDSPLDPKGAYEETKAESDRLVAASGLARVILRPSIVFGPSMPNRSLFQLIAAVDRGLFFFIGPPGASANYVHVDNVVDALMLCGRHPAAPGRVYNLSDHASLEDFAAMIAAALGKAPPRLRLPRALALAAARTAGRLPGFPLTESRVRALTGRAVYGSERIARELGYAPSLSLSEGLRRTVEAWRAGQSPSIDR